MSGEIRKMDEYPQFTRILIYGHPGVGKTPLAATSPGRMLILNADGPDGPSSAKISSTRARASAPRGVSSLAG